MRRTPKRKVTSDFDAEDVHDIVNHLINGMSIARVPEEVHPQLLMPLSAAKNEAIVAGNHQRVKRIKQLMEQLHLNPGKTKEQIRSRSNNMTRPAKTYSKQNDDDIDALVDQLIDGRPPETVNGSSLPTIIPKLKERKTETKTNGDFKTAQKLENLIQEMNTRKLEFSYASVNNSRLAQLQFQLMEAKAKYQEDKQRYLEERKLFHETFENSLEEKKEQQRLELEEYDNEFPENLPLNFRKNSPLVLQLRDQARHLVGTNRFEEAIPFYKKADEIEREEIQQKREKFIDEFHKKRCLILSKQKTEMECFETNWKRKEKVFEKDYQAELSADKQLVVNIERRIQRLQDDATESLSVALPQNRAISRQAPRTVQIPSGRMRNSPAELNPRVRTMAASRINRKPIVRKMRNTQ